MKRRYWGVGIYPYVHFCLTTGQELGIQYLLALEYSLDFDIRASFLVYIYLCCRFITWRVHGRFYGLDLKKVITNDKYNIIIIIIVVIIIYYIVLINLFMQFFSSQTKSTILV